MALLVRIKAVLNRMAPLALATAFAIPALMAGPGVMAQENGQIIVPLEADGIGAGDSLADELARERFAEERARGTPATQNGAVPVQISPLRPIAARGLPQGSTIRFDGENHDLEFALFVPDPSAVQSLRIATLSSINLLPERSNFSVYVNDQPVGEGRLAFFTDFGATELPVAPGILTPGHNRVQIRLNQYHRIFCGPEASFSLWSDIDLANSGAVIEGAGPEASEQSFLMGLAQAAASGDGVEIRGTEGLGEQRGAWVEQITQRLTMALGGDPVPFRFTGYWAISHDGPATGRVTFLPGDSQRVSFRMGGDGAQVMVIEYVPGQPPQPMPELDAALPALPGHRPPALVSTGQPVQFSDFGFRTIEVSEHYALIEQRFRLPDDYVVLTNAKAGVSLDYIYAEALPPGAMLLVYVNGQNIRLLPLHDQGGRLIEQFPLRFEARHLRAGSNTLAFEVMIPGEPADLPCPTWDGPVLRIGDGSTLFAPYSPSMYLPDMHFAFRALTADSLSAQSHATQSFSGGELIALRAALAGSAVAGAADPAARLHLMSLDDLASVPMGGYAVSRQAIENVLLGGPVDDAPPPGGPGSSLMRMSGDSGGTRQPSAGLSTGWDWAVGLFQRGVQWLHPRSGVLLEQWLERRHGQAVLLHLLQLDAERPGDIWLLRAPGSDTGALAAAIVAARTVTEGPRGQVSVLDHAGSWQNWIAPDRQPILLEAVTPGNLRHVLGNMLSARPIRYVIVLFFLALVAALVALRLVISTREHSQ